MEKIKKKFKMKKKYFWIGGAVLAIILVIGIVAFSGKDYVASINGEKISEKELNDLLVSQYGTDVLDTLITQKVIEKEMEKENIKVTQEEIDAEIAEYEEYYGGKEAFQTVLESSGIDISTLENNIKLYLGRNKLMEDDIDITDEEMQTYFDENKDSLGQAEEVEASHILVDDEETAKEIIAKLDAGEDFAELAKEYSTDTSTAENGGELGYFGTGVMDTAFEEAAFAMEVGTYSREPVQTDYGYHIIKVTDHTEAKEAVYEDVKDDIKQTLFEQKADTLYSTWITEVMADYDIENYLSKS
ncbi:peptidylprolyl isomerase [Caldibacillus thermoamylovorans]|jgi:foldase protein PrsA